MHCADPSLVQLLYESTVLHCCICALCRPTPALCVRFAAGCDCISLLRIGEARCCILLLTGFPCDQGLGFVRGLCQHDRKVPLTAPARSGESFGNSQNIELEREAHLIARGFATRFSPAGLASAGTTLPAGCAVVHVSVNTKTLRALARPAVALARSTESDTGA